MQSYSGHDDETYVRRLFQILLRRDPDQDAVSYYVESLRSGQTHCGLIDELCASDEYAFKLGAPLYVTPGHFYSPIVDPKEVKKHVDWHTSHHIEALAGISLDRNEMVATWRKLLPFLRKQIFTERATQGFRYRFDNTAFSWGDGLSLYAMLMLYRPKRIIEIGSGWSSACMVDTVERCFNRPCSITFIDPNPRLVRSLVGQGTAPLSFNIIDSQIQLVDVSLFDKLEQDDILFIDSTHICKTGSDVNFELFEILPRIKSGVLVHIHDMFWPFEYPSEWTLSDNRSWNEIYAIRAFLTDNDRWKIIFFNDYFAKIEENRVHAEYPDFLRNPGGSLWIQKL